MLVPLTLYLSPFLSLQRWLPNLVYVISTGLVENHLCTIPCMHSLYFHSLLKFHKTLFSLTAQFSKTKGNVACPCSRVGEKRLVFHNVSAGCELQPVSAKNQLQKAAAEVSNLISSPASYQHSSRMRIYMLHYVYSYSMNSFSNMQDFGI